MKWTEYCRLDGIRGNIFFIKGNKRIQLITDERIYFYLIDQITLMPKLDNTMGNFVECSQMMFGPTLRYCITYKSGQPDFAIYTRNYIHNF